MLVLGVLEGETVVVRFGAVAVVGDGARGDGLSSACDGAATKVAQTPSANAPPADCVGVPSRVRSPQSEPARGARTIDSRPGPPGSHWRDCSASPSPPPASEDTGDGLPPTTPPPAEDGDAGGAARIASTAGVDARLLKESMKR